MKCYLGGFFLWWIWSVLTFLFIFGLKHFMLDIKIDTLVWLLGPLFGISFLKPFYLSMFVRSLLDVELCFLNTEGWILVVHPFFQSLYFYWGIETTNMERYQWPMIVDFFILLVVVGLFFCVWFSSCDFADLRLFPGLHGCS